MPSPFSTTDAPIMAIDAVTPSDTVAVPGNTRYLRCGGAGNLIVRAPGSASDTTINAAAGEYVPAGPGTLVKTTSTATAIVAFGV